MYRIGVIGNFDRSNAFDGQTIKTLEIVNALTRKYGEKNIGQFSYHAIKKNPAKLFSMMFSAVKNSKQLVLVIRGAAMNNLVKIVQDINLIFKRPLYFILVGSSFYDTILDNKALIKRAEKFKAIFVETEKIRNNLKSIGIENTYLLPNFKNIKLLKKSELLYQKKLPFNLVYFARIEPMKGIRECIEVIKEINAHGTIFTLDIYGSVNKDFIDEFNELQKTFPNYIKYLGIGYSMKSSEILSKYFLQVFPTRYKTEGFPASILDSFFAGTPVVASRWNYYDEIVEEGKTGLSFELDNFDELKKILLECAKNPDKTNSMKENCLKQAKKYLPDNICKKLFEVLEEYE